MKRIFLFVVTNLAVLGYEITHVANGDMVTLALLQGVLNIFVIFLARIVGSIADRLSIHGAFATVPATHPAQPIGILDDPRK